MTMSQFNYISLHIILFRNETKKKKQQRLLIASMIELGEKNIATIEMKIAIGRQ